MNKTFELSKPIPFLTAYTAGQYRRYVGGFKFVSVLTDGGFNPYNNNRTINPVDLCPDRDNDSWCYLLFDNGERLQLNGEIKNFELPADCKWFDLINSYAGISTCGTDSVDTGYNNMYIMLSMRPVNLEIPKLPPFFEVLGQEVAADTHLYLHLGSRKVNATDTLIIPYLPLDYDYQLQILAAVESAASTAFDLSLVLGMPDDDNQSHKLGTISFGNHGLSSQGYKLNTYTLTGARRVSIDIFNGDLDYAYKFWLRGTFYRLG